MDNSCFIRDNSCKKKRATGISIALCVTLGAAVKHPLSIFRTWVFADLTALAFAVLIPLHRRCLHALCRYLLLVEPLVSTPLPHREGQGVGLYPSSSPVPESVPSPLSPPCTSSSPLGVSVPSASSLAVAQVSVAPLMALSMPSDGL